MKSLRESLCIALAMYSTVPVKILDWNEKNLRNAMAFFPIIGILCDLGLWCVWIICQWLECGSFIFAVLAVTWNVAITGGIHYDGFCDTVDARCSHRSIDDKLRILKDPNCGPFAVLHLALILLCAVAAYTQLYRIMDSRILGLMGFLFIQSRCFSGSIVTALPATKSSSLAKTFGSHAGKHVTAILITELCLVGVLSIVLFSWFTLLMLLYSSLLYVWFYRMQKREFGGITGDLCGYFLVSCETGNLLLLALLGGVLL